MKHSSDSVYLYAEMHNRRKFEEAMEIHRMKIAIQVGLCIFVAQMVIALLIIVI
jgi:hypothetical protein